MGVWLCEAVFCTVMQWRESDDCRDDQCMTRHQCTKRQDAHARSCRQSDARGRPLRPSSRRRSVAMRHNAQPSRPSRSGWRSQRRASRPRWCSAAWRCGRIGITTCGRVRIATCCERQDAWWRNHLLSLLRLYRAAPLESAAWFSSGLQAVSCGWTLDGTFCSGCSRPWCCSSVCAGAAGGTDDTA